MPSADCTLATTAAIAIGDRVREITRTPTNYEAGAGSATRMSAVVAKLEPLGRPLRCISAIRAFAGVRADRKQFPFHTA